MNYEQAIKTPKAGWVNATEEQMLAALCQSLGLLLCMQPKAIFKWAKKHSSFKALKDASQRLTDHAGDMELLEAVLNDKPLDGGN